MRLLSAGRIAPAAALGLASGLLLWASVAGAQTQLLAGKRLALRQSPKSEHLVIVSRDQLVAPLPGGSDDPTFLGAVLDIGNPSTGEWARFMIPAAGWTVNALGTVFRYEGGRLRAVGAVRELVIRHGKRLKVRATAVGLTLDEPAQGELAVVLTLGSRRYCMLFAGDAVKRDAPRRFAARNAVAPTSCPVPAAANTTSTSTTSTSLAHRVSTTTSTRRTTQPQPTTTSTSTSSSSTRRSTTVTTSSTTSSTRAPTTTSISLQPTTTTSTSSSTSSSTSVSSTSTSSTSTSSTATPTSSTTTSTGYTCGGVLFCGGTCKPPAKCVGGLITRCHCEVLN